MKIVASLILAVCFLGLIALPTSEKDVYQPVLVEMPTPKPDTLEEEVLWSTVQEWRMREGNPTYIKDESLCELARLRLPEIRQDWSHNGWLSRKPTGYILFGENLAKGFVDEDQTLSAWLDSPGHAANLRRPYTHSCIQTEDGYAVHLFASY